MPDTSQLFLEILETEDVEGTLVETTDGVLELYIVPDTRVTALETAEYLEVYDGSVVIGGGYVPFVYDRAGVPSATWIINHGLGFLREPTVVLDSAPTVPVWADVVHGTLNQTTITFPTPVSGKAYF